MQYGKYPFEAYGSRGGWQRKNENNVAAGIGRAVGTVIGGLTFALFSIFAGLFRLCGRIAGSAFRGFNRGVKKSFAGDYSKGRIKS